MPGAERCRRAGGVAGIGVYIRQPLLVDGARQLSFCCFFQAEDGIRDYKVTGVQTCALRISICAETSIRVVGPSSLGVVDLRSKALITANAAFDEPDLPVGRIFAASHSGSMIGALLSRGKARGIGFAGLVSCGNEIDLSLGEICALTLDDPGIDGYMLFLETMRHADALRRFARAAADQGRPVI